MALHDQVSPRPDQSQTDIFLPPLSSDLPCGSEVHEKVTVVDPRHPDQLLILSHRLAAGRGEGLQLRELGLIRPRDEEGENLNFQSIVICLSLSRWTDGALVTCGGVPVSLNQPSKHTSVAWLMTFKLPNHFPCSRSLMAIARSSKKQPQSLYLTWCTFLDLQKVGETTVCVNVD